MGVRWLLTFARFSAQGHQVTPHLRAQGHQRPIAFGRFSAQGNEVTPCKARAPYRLEWVRERSPLPTVAADCWAGISEWAGILYTWQPLTWNWYHVNERVSSTHGRPLLGGWYHVNKRAVSSKPGSRWWGAGIMWMRECPLHTADCCWGAGIVWIREQCLPNPAAADEGLVSCEWVRSQVIVLCSWQNAALRRGAACLDSVFFRAASAATWEPLAPVSTLGSPLRHERGTCEAGLMSCPAGSMGERNADI